MNVQGFEGRGSVERGVVIDLIGGNGSGGGSFRDAGAEHSGGCGLVGKGLGKRDGGT